jgi:hypothetical protein
VRHDQVNKKISSGVFCPIIDVVQPVEKKKHRTYGEQTSCRANLFRIFVSRNQSFVDWQGSDTDFRIRNHPKSA